MQEIRQWAESVIANVEKAFFGKRAVIEKILAALLARGHVLVEDVPGLGKTILARAVAQSLGGVFMRIQCTPDLLPADILGVMIYNPKTGDFNYRRGPILSNILLVDEINRATPRTQSALLEAMAENQISVEGKRVALPEPFFLMATENPVEFEGTFPLPEAQKDRFLMTIAIGYPDRAVEEHILESQRRLSHPVTEITEVSDKDKITAFQEQVVRVQVHPGVRSYILDIVEETRRDSRFQLGVSPRGTLALYKACQALAAIRGRNYILPEDVKELAVNVLQKRVILKSEYLIKGVTSEELLSGILDRLPVPVIKETLGGRDGAGPRDTVAK